MDIMYKSASFYIESDAQNNSYASNDSVNSFMYACEMFFEPIAKAQDERSDDKRSDDEHATLRDKLIKSENEYRLLQILYSEQFKTYLRNNNLIDDKGNMIDDECAFREPVLRDWYCFMFFNAEDASEYWLINVNPNCELFEYVIYCGENMDTDIYKFSERLIIDNLLYNSCDILTTSADDDSNK